LLALVCARLGRRHGLHEVGAHRGDLLAFTFWQVMVGVAAFAIFYLVFEGVPKFELQWRTWGGLLFNGILGTGIACSSGSTSSVG
jgi:drug/metabolite transporter (DMT)-like permease